MRIHHNKTFDCYEDCEQDINAFGKEIFLDGHKLYTKADLVAMLEELKKEIVDTTIPKATILGEILWNSADAMKKEIGTRIQEKIDKLKEGRLGYMDESKSEVEEAANNMTEDAYTKEEVIGILEEVRKQLKDMRTDFYEQGHKDVSFGINIGMEEIQRKIYKLKENINGNK